MLDGMWNTGRLHRSRAAMTVASLASLVIAAGSIPRWERRWRASLLDAASCWPGDAVVAEPRTVVTRAITIDAGREQVWPWIVQLGADRAGVYSYDWLEDLCGLAIHSASEIVPEWQHLEVGDVVRADRRGRGGWQVVTLRPFDTLALAVADVETGRPFRRDEGIGWEFVWSFHLEPVTHDRTTLLVRETVAFRSPWRRRLFVPVGLISFVMTRKMLLGMRARAEGLRTAPDTRLLARFRPDRSTTDGRPPATESQPVPASRSGGRR